MASNNNKNNNNTNQPRRKRNKKPVKRYSEEYTNRPNPYTGYSADGNYHPDAKKHPTDEASVAASKKIQLEAMQADEINSDVAEAEQTEVNTSASSQAVEVKTSHRKRNIDREAEKQAKQAKNEARKAAVDQIAKGVAAHSVSEQIIEDISSMSDAIESMAKKENTAKAVAEIDVEAEENTIIEAVASEIENEAQDNESIDIVAPVELGENDVLPFDMPAEETSDVTENIEKTEDADVSDVEVEPEQAEEIQEEIPVIHPLNPADLIPVLDFDKPPAPVLNFTEGMVQKTDDSDNIISSLVNTKTIEEILDEVEQENLASAQQNIESATFGSDIIFDTANADEWDNVILPPDEEVLTNDTEASDNSLSKLLEECFNSEDETSAYSYDESDDIFETSDDDASVAAEAISAVVSDSFIDLTDEAREDISDITDEIFASDENDSEEKIESPDESDFVEAEDSASAEIDVDAEGISVDSSVLVERADAVNEKLQKIVEAAELAELLRLENEEVEELIDATAKEDATDSDEDEAVDIEAESDDASDVKNDDDTDSDEKIKEYHPVEKKKSQEDVFESVLIVDEAVAPSEEDLEEQDDTLFLRAKGVGECPTAVFKLPEGPIILPTDIDDGDFQEQWLDDDEDGDEMASRNKRARRRLSAFIGAVSILCVLIGVGWVLKTTLTGFNNIGSTGAKKAEYTEFISPVVINDPTPFESVEEADNQMLLESAIWSVLDSVDNESGYEYNYDATGKIILPGKDVAEAGKRLFGNKVKLNMDVLSESDGSVLYYYDSIEDKFHISTGGIEGPSAVITKIASKSDHVSLIVGYCSQTSMTVESADTVEAYKYMEYILALNDDGTYYIQSIRNYTDN